jgi:hypothetical protein
MLVPLWLGFSKRKEIVMTFSRPLLGFCIAALVGSCGGGDDASPGPTGDRNAPIIVSPVTFSSGATVAFVGQTVHFSGGVCSGGYGKLFVKWTYGDGSEGASNVHTYGSPGKDNTVRVTCTDASNNDKKYGITTLTFDVAP